MTTPDPTTVTVYSMPNCHQCEATKNALNKKNIPHKVIDVTENPKSLTHIKGLGYLQAPVVEGPTGHWSGFRPDLILQLAQHQ
ncbi:glutaredoxin domain-containing protein [Timonella senegalensis]|uniref:glutaredoxin domain-containing protein n=1 Tax=Timonella senegalensis TaxID=1465825 RepID=UPI0002D35E4A|nr:glutaredoxin domain-containing protein [Timonella senegalensis]